MPFVTSRRAIRQLLGVNQIKSVELEANLAFGKLSFSLLVEDLEP